MKMNNITRNQLIREALLQRAAKIDPTVPLSYSLSMGFLLTERPVTLPEHNSRICGCAYLGMDMWSCGHIDNDTMVLHGRRNDSCL